METYWRARSGMWRAKSYENQVLPYMGISYLRGRFVLPSFIGKSGIVKKSFTNICSKDRQFDSDSPVDFVLGFDYNKAYKIVRANPSKDGGAKL